MKHASTLLALAVVLSLPARIPAQGAPSPTAVTEAEALARQLSQDLRDARKLLPRITDRETRNQLELILTRNELRAADLQRQLARLAIPAKPVAISEQDFAPILAGMQTKRFDNDRLTYLQDLGKSRRYTCAQVRKLLKQFSFDDHRIRAAGLMHPFVVDPENTFTLLDEFTFDSSKQKVRELLKLK